MCPWCEEKEETLIHLLEDCNFAKEVWDTNGGVGIEVLHLDGLLVGVRPRVC